MRKNIFWFAVLLILIATFFTCWHYYHRIERFWGITQTDFNVYYYSGWYIVQKQSMYTFTNPEYLFKYAPIFGVAMIPLAHLPIQIALRWWYGLICFSYLGILWLLKNLLRGNRSDLPLTVYGMLLAATLRPYLSTLRLGQIDVLLAFLLLAALIAGLRKKDFLSGVLFGIVILSKLVPAVWFIWMFIEKRWRILFWTVASIALYLFLPALRLGWSGNISALHEWKNILTSSGSNIEWLVRFKNQSVLSLILRTLAGTDASAITPMQVQLAFAMTGLLGLAYLAWVIRIASRTQNQKDFLPSLAAPAMLMIAMVIFSPNSWKATYIHLALPYALVAAYLTTLAPKDKTVWGLFVMSLILTVATAPDIFLGRANSQALHLFSPMTWGALALAGAVAKITRAGR